MADDHFIDYYELMQISPACEPEAIQRVYETLAARYDPANARTGDVQRFERLNQAYQVLSNPRARAAYDKQLRARRLQPIAVFETRQFNPGIDSEPIRRMGILCVLYNRRRSNPDSPGLPLLELEVLMSLPREQLTFTLWYLKDASLVRQEQNSDMVITAAGVDHIEKHLSEFPQLHDYLKSCETGDVERFVRPPNAGAPGDR